MRTTVTLDDKMVEDLREGLGIEETSVLIRRALVEMRQRLVVYFDRKNCLTPDEFADETLNRVARRLEEAGTIEIETPAKYCYITAKFVFIESLRGADQKSVPLDDVLRQQQNNQTVSVKEDEKKD